SIVCDPLLFFYEHESGRLLRFVDTNIEGLNRRSALAELKRLHPKFYSDNLIAGHFYIDVGAVLAADLLRDYFRSSGNLNIPLVVDKEGTQQSWLKSSPILLGTARTNTVIKRIFGAPETKELAYRLHAKRYAWVTIDDPKARDREALAKLGKAI